MHRYTCALALILMTMESYSQETDMITISFPDSKQPSQLYHVLKSDGKTRHGDYISYFRIPEERLQEARKDSLMMSNYIKSKGQYENGKKTGEWQEYSRPSQLKSKGRFLNDRKAGIWFTYKEHGQVVERFDYDNDVKLQPEIRVSAQYPTIAKERGIEGTVIVSYKINSDCTVSNVQIDSGISTECDSAAIKSIRRFGDYLKRYGFDCEEAEMKQNINFVLK